MLRLFGHYISLPALVLAAVELAIIIGLVFFVGEIVEQAGFTVDPGGKQWLSIMNPLGVFFGMLAFGLYTRPHFFLWEDVLSRSLILTLVLIVIMTILVFVRDRFFPHYHILGNYLLSFFALLAFCAISLIIRRSFIEFVDRTGAFKRRVLIIGSGQRAAKINELCSLHRDRSFTVVGYVHFGSVPPDSGGNCRSSSRRQAARRGDYWVEPQDLSGFCQRNKVEELVMALSERRGLPVRDLLDCKLRGIAVTEYASFWEREGGQIDLDGISPSWLVFSEGFHIGILRALVKRLFDIAISLVVLVLTLPITVVTAALIRLDSPGPIFYRQERVGLNGNTFHILKFRSMRVDAEKDGPIWAARQDQRVTRVGLVIRKIRIDEIPQIVNVLKGDMAFVGPRPERPVFVKALSDKIPYYIERHIAKPGITGWAQINYPYGATEEDAKMKLSYDLYYIKNGSLFLDILILIQTTKVLVWNAGAR